MHANTPQSMSRLSRRCIICVACVALACILCVHAEPGDIGNVAKSAEFGFSSITEAADQHTSWWKVKWLPEGLIAAFLLAYIANIWNGRAQNADIALAFGDVFCHDGSLLERNFSQVGARIQGSPDIVLREAMHRFQIFATGRRFCQSFQASLNMKHRQDLFYMLCYFISPSEDQIDIDITMNEANMQPLVLLIAAPRLAKSLAKSLPDVQSLARPIDVDRKRLPSFPSDKLTVWAESPNVFYDLMTDRVMDLLFGRAAFEDASRYFRHLHFSSDSSEGLSKQSLRFTFKLPPKNQMQDLTKVMTAVMHFIDVVGSHELSSEAKDKALKRREQRAAAEHKTSASERLEAQQLKRQEKQQEQAEKVKRMTPEQRAKYEARQERVQTKRAMKSRMIRI